VAIGEWQDELLSHLFVAGPPTDIGPVNLNLAVPTGEP
jgi:hypothetical protein